MLDAFNPATTLSGLREFLETGGNVLVVIMIATFVMWAFIVERLAYWGVTIGGVTVFPSAHEADARRALETWGATPDKAARPAHWIRDKLVSEVRQKAEQNVELIKTLVAIAPLLGLLGTVTGMVAVFDVMAISGSSNARAMSAGVSKATIPTMAGMVSALSGLLFSYRIERNAKTKVQELADKLQNE